VLKALIKMELSQITFDFIEPAPEKEDDKKKSGKKTYSQKQDPNQKIKSVRGRKSLKSIGGEADSVEIPEDDILFRKLYYPIGDVAHMFKVNTSLIRYWENEFDILKPKKNTKGDRHFRPEDVKNLQLIYHLLRERKYTIEGAKEFLRSNKSAAEKFQIIKSLQKLKSFLLELQASL
jgi:DNA-binding transcriptional MerR regulator